MHFWRVRQSRKIIVTCMACLLPGLPKNEMNLPFGNCYLVHGNYGDEMKIKNMLIVKNNVGQG